MYKSLSVYIFLDSEPELGKSKEFINIAMEVQVKGFESCSLSRKKQYKSRQIFHEIFFHV